MTRSILFTVYYNLLLIVAVLNLLIISTVPLLPSPTNPTKSHVPFNSPPLPTTLLSTLLPIVTLELKVEMAQKESSKKPLIRNSTVYIIYFLIQAGGGKYYNRDAYANIGANYYMSIEVIWWNHHLVNVFYES